MNSFTKVGNDWCVRVFPYHNEAPGQQVTVVTRAGQRKLLTLGELVRSDQYGKVYRVAFAPRQEAVQVGDLSRILAMFARAATRLRSPAITFDTFRVSVAGPRAREPGSLTVTGVDRNMPSRFGNGMTFAYFGRVTRAGSFEPSGNAPEGLGERLRAFAADPVAVATAHGLRGRCCFCNHRLGEGEDRRSVEIGYGPDCADNFGLPWGARAARDAQAFACEPVQQPAPLSPTSVPDTRQGAWVD